eukprot:CAMPEP_0185595434 /NCGR_PEP_ID=MMETSP0434-20130131/78377_1 /TAXON_ID=626734 ORGANISM="Favella taraikaensis, Strain Fe Narragansett Bay" /NCGR_SAMPLE_ID=MMETSP0434 /ASSEMBLY_ACC=CAM_ASM_000379 /LENGTH=142 /DNA_ID=CAMNT_0028223435 /DNA_START=243 /DNA_END=671 /DNA_ORIENTATION=-
MIDHSPIRKVSGMGDPAMAHSLYVATEPRMTKRSLPKLTNLLQTSEKRKESKIWRRSPIAMGPTDETAQSVRHKDESRMFISTGGSPVGAGTHSLQRKNSNVESIASIITREQGLRKDATSQTTTLIASFALSLLVEWGIID